MSRASPAGCGTDPATVITLIFHFKYSIGFTQIIKLHKTFHRIFKHPPPRCFPQELAERKYDHTTFYIVIHILVVVISTGRHMNFSIFYKRFGAASK